MLLQNYDKGRGSRRKEEKKIYNEGSDVAICLLRYHMPHKNFYVSRKEELGGGDGGAKYRNTDTVKKFVAPCRSKEKNKK